jgi:hypothetical protein
MFIMKLAVYEITILLAVIQFRILSFRVLSRNLETKARITVVVSVLLYLFRTL